MATTIVNIESSKVISNLDTYNYTATRNGPHFVLVRLSEVPNSSISIAIKQGASTLATSTAPVAGQNHIEIQTTMMCTIGDVIGVVITSSAAIDSNLNGIKGIIKITPGLQ